MRDSDTELRDDVVRDASERGYPMDLRDLVALIERRHPGGRGVAPDLVRRYIHEVASETGTVDAEVFERNLEENRTDADEWVGADAVYELDDGRVSAYPRVWHEELDGVTDIATHLAVMHADIPDTNEAFDVGGAGYGVPKSVLLESVVTLGGGDYHQAELKLGDLREEGVLAVDASQHPQARVQFTDDARPDSLEVEEGEPVTDHEGEVREQERHEDEG